MPGEVAQELMLAILKNLQEGQGRLEAQMREMNAQMVASRGHMHAIQSDVANLYATLHRIDLRLDRVERRLGLSEFV